MNSNTKFTILVVEDEPGISLLICNDLKAHGYRTIQASTGQEGLSHAASYCPDVILLDLGLPDMDGAFVIRKLRTWSGVPIIVISARIQEQEKIEALDAGADDYVTKPFHTNELRARIRAALRRSNRLRTDSEHYTSPYRAGGLVIDFDKRMVTLKDEIVHLTPVEYQMVSFLAQNAGRVVTYSTLIEHVWGPYSDKDNNRILRVNMANIRRKLGEKPGVPQYIATEVRVGYRMMDDEQT